MNDKQPTIGFIGAGRVGFTLGRYFSENGLRISGYYNRTPDNAKAASEFTNSVCYFDINEVIDKSDIVFITVSDNAIVSVVDTIVNYSIKNKIFCHCSGAMSSAVFSRIEQAGAYGYSVHPIFAINDKQNSYKEISKAFFTIEGNSEYLELVVQIIRKLGNKVQVIERNNKTKYHSAAVMASNLIIGLYEMSVDTLVECGFEREIAYKALMPLFLNNADNIERYGTKRALTGPIDRADTNTVSKHLKVLDGDVHEVYRLISKRLVELAIDKRTSKDVVEDTNAFDEIISLLNNK